MYKFIAASLITTRIDDDSATPVTPATVPTTSGVTLAERMRLNDLPLATTPGGRAFCLKALHPSEHTIKAARCPGGNKNSLAVCCDMISTLPLGSGDIEVQLAQMASPLHPCYVTITDNSTTTSNYYVFFNAAFGGSVVANPKTVDYQNMMGNMLARISNYRVTSQSVTMELIAPSLTDQGTIVASQYSLPPRTVQPTKGENSPFQAWSYPDFYIYPEPMSPEQTLLGTSAYTAKARDGCYQPLKLSSFKWKDMNDVAVFASRNPTYLQGNSEIIVNMDQPIRWPTYEDRTSVTKWSELCPMPKLTSDIFGLITMTGTANAMYVRIRVRQVVEITCRPGTLYAPMLEIPLPPDELALKMYFEISGRLKDGYPSEWNSLGTLGRMVLTLGKTLFPLVDPALKTAADALKKSDSKVAQVAGKVIDVVAPGVSSGLEKGVTKASRRRQKKKVAKQAALESLAEKNLTPEQYRTFMMLPGVVAKRAFYKQLVPNKK